MSPLAPSSPFDYHDFRAILSKATHLLTGDVAHFKPHFGKRIHGVRILRPAEYLAGAG